MIEDVKNYDLVDVTIRVQRYARRGSAVDSRPHVYVGAETVFLDDGEQPLSSMTVLSVSKVVQVPDKDWAIIELTDPQAHCVGGETYRLVRLPKRFKDAGLPENLREYDWFGFESDGSYGANAVAYADSWLRANPEQWKETT